MLERFNDWLWNRANGYQFFAVMIPVFMGMAALFLGVVIVLAAAVEP